MAVKKFGLFFLYVFLGLLAVLILSYASIVFLSKEKSLPRLTMYEKNVGNLSRSDILLQVESIEKNLLARSIVIITPDGERVSKTFNDFGVRLDETSAVNEILAYGKYKKYYPLPSYILRSIREPVKISLEKNLISTPTTQIAEIFKDKKQDSVNASFLIQDNNLAIAEEKNGYEINTAELSGSITDAFLKQTPEIKAQTREIKCEVTKDALQSYKSLIEEFINKKFRLESDQKTVYPKKDELLSWLDLERVLLEHKLIASDQQIGSYLGSTLSKRINVNGQNRVVSTYDNSVISEGREGIRIDLDKTKANIKSAVEDNALSARVETTASEIQEETIGPGFTPGKFSGKYIEVNLSEQMLYTLEGDRLVGQYKVSTGKWSMPTPEGEYYINNKDPRAYSNEYNLYMPYWMAFIGSQYGIHELPEWPDGTKEGESHLGTPVSHGCIRLGRGSAEEVYNWAEIGTIVYTHK